MLWRHLQRHLSGAAAGWAGVREETMDGITATSHMAGSWKSARPLMETAEFSNLSDCREADSTIISARSPLSIDGNMHASSPFSNGLECQQPKSTAVNDEKPLNSARDNALVFKQAEWEKRMETADEEQTKIFHFQMNLIREQVSNLTREMSMMRADVEAVAVRSAESSREQVRNLTLLQNSQYQATQETFQKIQCEVGTERKERMSVGEEFVRALGQLKQVVDHERAERGEAFKCLSFEASDLRVKMQDVAARTSALDGEQASRHSQLVKTAQTFDELTQAITNDVKEACASLETSQTTELKRAQLEIQELRETLAKEISERTDLSLKMQGFASAFQDEKYSSESKQSGLHLQVHRISEECDRLKSDLQMIEGRVELKVASLRKSLETEASERAIVKDLLDKRFVEHTAWTSQEIHANGVQRSAEEKTHREAANSGVEQHLKTQQDRLAYLEGHLVQFINGEHPTSMALHEQMAKLSHQQTLRQSDLENDHKMVSDQLARLSDHHTSAHADLRDHVNSTFVQERTARAESLEAVESNVRKEIANIDGKCTTVQELLRQERAERDAGHGFIMERLDGLEVKQNNELCQVTDATAQQIRELSERVVTVEKLSNIKEFVVEPARPLLINAQVPSVASTFPSVASTSPLSPGGPGSITLSVGSGYTGSASTAAVAAQAIATNVALAAVPGTTATPPAPAAAAVTVRPPSPTLPITRRDFSPRRSLKLSPRRSLSKQLRTVTPPPPARSSSPLANRRATVPLVMTGQLPVSGSTGQLPVAGSLGYAGGSSKVVVGTVKAATPGVPMSPGGSLSMGVAGPERNMGVAGPLSDNVEKPKKVGGTPPPQTKSVTALRAESANSGNSQASTGTPGGSGTPYNRTQSMNSQASARTVTPSGTARVETTTM